MKEPFSEAKLHFPLLIYFQLKKGEKSIFFFFQNGCESRTYFYLIATRYTDILHNKKFLHENVIRALRCDVTKTIECLCGRSSLKQLGVRRLNLIRSKLFFTQDRKIQRSLGTGMLGIKVKLIQRTNHENDPIGPFSIFCQIL